MTGRGIYVMACSDPDGVSGTAELVTSGLANAVTAGQRMAGILSCAWLPFWVDTILSGEDRFVIRPRVRVSPGRTAWFNLDGWRETPYERRWPVPDLNPEAFIEHVLTSPDNWMRDVARQDMRHILGGRP